MLNRLKNPVFLAAAIAFLYQFANFIANRYLGVVIDPKTWQEFFNLVFYIIIGAGIYSSYQSNSPTSAVPPVVQPLIPQTPNISPTTPFIPAHGHGPDSAGSPAFARPEG